MEAQPLMVRRVAAAQATLDHWKGRPFELGKADCARMVAFHLRQLKVRLKIGKAGSYATPLSARRALIRAGYDSLADALDKHGLARIPPAAALVGDILALPAEDDLGALAVAVGNGRVLAWHPDVEGAAVLQPAEFVAAWAVI